MTLPDLTAYVPHRITADADFEGTVVPGLRAEFFRRPDGDRIASVGRYSYLGREVLMAWGFVDEQHCRWHAVHDPVDGWQATVDGCPDIRKNPDTIEVRTPTGAWLPVGA
ncbi:hypothetical protein [Actinoplanes derwentensis]|uniref:Uncharacterized protein n=1 Tax=Actinoplanes derwentensis TaxID=113562 RepID=A0A1H1V2K7_9ACTN|nr:hypothetical protein [Actinoplanes derwentensis]GID89824.1 hypothetical protein Ade03nite_87480 [Actinoplanes derwentensis]SDS78449.1 hypothetical protein SAMN04489716_1608 [Actinoplanes derwentensis]